MILTHEQAEMVGTALCRRINGGRAAPHEADAMGWADVVQFVLLQAREIVAAQDADTDRALRDSQVSRPPVTRTIAELKAGMDIQEEQA